VVVSGAPHFPVLLFDDLTLNNFELAKDNPSNSAAADTVYVAMGTEGVLVGSTPGSSSDQPWRLTGTGIDLLNPLPLTLTDPLAVLGVILLALLVPPLPWIHAYLLSRVWVNLLPRPPRLALCLAHRWWIIGPGSICHRPVADQQQRAIWLDCRRHDTRYGRRWRRPDVLPGG
jgi:hypothetical protein